MQLNAISALIMYQNIPLSCRSSYVTDIFWRVNVLYFVGIGSQPEKTWRHRELTAPEVVVRNHGNGGINNNMAAK